LSPKKADPKRLGTYRAKRSPEATPEPFGGARLLVKKVDAWSGPGGRKNLGPESVPSGPTLEEVKEDSQRASEVRKELLRLKAPQHPLDVHDPGLMLAETREEPFSDAGWLFELKSDGYRILAAREGGRGVLLFRRGAEATSVFPEISEALSALPFPNLVMDGEVVVLEEDGRPSFQKLQRRALLSRGLDIAQAAGALPASFYAFDLLGFEDFDLRSLPLLDRKALLRQVVPRAGPLRFSDHIEGRGREFFEEVRERGLEGIVAKKADSAYRAGRSPLWLKIRLDRTDDFVIVGLSAPKGGRSGFGALYLAISNGADLVYAGRVGSGFSEADLAEISAKLLPHETKDPPCTGAPKGQGDVWLEPCLLCEVRYKEWARDGHLRHPVFLRLREDKPLADALPRRRTRPSEAPAPAGESRIAFTNLEKVFWPEDGFTKGDLIEYYRRISPWLLRYLKDRPLVLTRYPNGIHGKNFFQKDAPDFAPGWVRTEKTWSDHAQREVDYFVADDENSLLYLANLGTIPLHIWSSRVASPANPDWSILDLDPKGAPFTDVVAVALAIRRICDDMELPTFVKTSGSTGLHVLVPLGGTCSYAESRSLAELISRVVVRELPKIATMVRAVSSRGGRVYLDFLQNGHGRLLVSPFSVRPLPGATVSTPLKWSEVTSKLDPSRFTIRTVPERFDTLKDDPLVPLLAERPDLSRALARLLERVKP
jgi:bifunctional non-homologous end joining protein LigD